MEVSLLRFSVSRSDLNLATSLLKSSVLDPDELYPDPDRTFKKKKTVSHPNSSFKKKKPVSGSDL